MLTAIVALPLVGSLLAMGASPRSGVRPRLAALVFSVLEVGLVALAGQRALAQGSLVEALGASPPSFWSLRLDGLALPLVALTAVLGVVAVLASWRVEEREGAHHALLLALQAAVAGVFLADNVILFYLFWEAVLIPMYFLIGLWGHEDRKHAALKFFVYTFAGSALMLVGILVAVTSTGGRFAIGDIVKVGLPANVQQLVFWLMAAGFLVKVPAFPLHTWLPDAHVEAPTAGSIMLAGVLLKMGGYGLIRLAVPMAPQAFGVGGPVLAALGMAGILYGALVAMAQNDLKRMVAYSSVSHMGFVLLAVGTGTALGVDAAMLVMVSHGLVAGMLFLLVGLLYDRTHTREIARLGGLQRSLPAWGFAFTFAALASLGLPALSGFPGELGAMLEGFTKYGWWMIVPSAGLVVAVAFHLSAIRKVNTGPQMAEWSSLPDLSAHEIAAALPLAAGILALGVWPALVTAVTGPVGRAVVAVLGGGR